MPNDLGNNQNNNVQNKFPNQGNFSASQNTQLNQGKSITNNPSNPIDSTKKEVAKKGVEAAATAVGGPLAGQAAKAVANSKLGNKALNAATNLSKNPIKKLGSSLNPLQSMGMGLGTGIGAFKKNKELDEEASEDEENEDGSNAETDNDTLIPKEITKKVGPAIAIGSLGCLCSLIFIAIIAAFVLSPIMHVYEVIKDVKGFFGGIIDGIVYWAKGCKNEQECQQKQMDTFYETLVEVHDKYKGAPYYVTLNTELITATLTYYDPMAIYEEYDKKDLKDNDDLTPSTMVDYKKSRKKIEILAEHMVGNGKKCVDSLGTVLAYYKEEEKDTACPPPDPEYYYASTDDEAKDKKTPNVVSKEDWYYLDEDKYKKYLEDEFIRKFYFNNENNEETNKKVSVVINDIYQRVELFKYLTGEKNTSSSFIGNNGQVIVESCSSDIPVAQVSLFEYIQGVMYNEAGLSNPIEYQKAMAVVIKNYLFAINGATVDNVPTTFRVKSCTKHQVYCSVTEGCHKMADGTFAPGPDESGNYYSSFGPITDIPTLESLNGVINETFSVFITDSNGKFVTTQYKTNCSQYTCAPTNDMGQAEAIAMANSGMNYIDILNHFYTGNIGQQEISIVGTGLPLDIGSYTVSSEFGSRDCTDPRVSCGHNGIDLATTEGHNVYSILSGTVVRAELTGYTSSWGWYVKIGHDLNGDGNYDIYSGYAHLYPGSVLVSVGQTVSAGQKIASSGGFTYPTGSSTGAHLHFEIYEGCSDPSCRVNPRTYLNF